MRQRFANLVKSHAWQGNESMHDLANRLAYDFQIVFEQEVVASMDRSGQRVLDRNDSEAGLTACYGVENIF